MQNAYLTRLSNSSVQGELISLWQLIKHDANKRQAYPSIHFNCELLPADYSNEVTNLAQTDHGVWEVTTSNPAFLGNRSSIPRYLFKQALDAYFNLGTRAPIDFFSIINHRYLTLQCQTDMKFDITKQLEEESFPWNQDKQHISRLLANLTGIDPQQTVLPHVHLIQYIALFGCKAANNLNLTEMLEDYFCCPFEITPIELEYQPIIKSSLTQIGISGQNHLLGLNALVGKYAPLSLQKIAISICPTDYQNYMNMYGHSGLVKALDFMIKSYMGAYVNYKLFMKVNSQYLPKLQLLYPKDSHFRLGLSAWMDSPKMKPKFVQLPLSIQ
ncbi:type VI secretion system baseplate subunit TssG [Parashewanella tropica]|uniref:type VI secretion system baseplate subunit TssG n=1 Tax=Parashewanella tropica TaxID=2547970 RepID=UPI0010596F5C|nr:type VI secretion system baseplate subunit TssG [Parashewanella tropica]